MMGNFLQDFFINPIVNFQGYNLFNTLFYGLILLGIAFGIVYPYFNKKGIKFNSRFAGALLPYILLGIGLRILEDMRILPREANPFSIWFYTFSPGIWILIGAITILGLGLSGPISKALKKEKIVVFAGIGAVLCLPVLLFDFLFFKELIGLGMVIVSTAVFFGIAFLASKKLKKFIGTDLMQSSISKLVVLGQALDGAATFVSLNFFKCIEQHVLSDWIIQTFSPLAFPVVKIALALVVLYAIEKEVDDDNLKGFMKIFIIILGFATGLRDLFTLAVGTCGFL